MDKKHGCAARTLARSLVNQLKAGAAHGIERALSALDAKGYVSESSASTVLVDQFLHGGAGGERFEQLDQVWPPADFEQHLAHLVGSADFLAMNLSEAKRTVGFDLVFELALLDGNRHMVHELNARNFLQFFWNAAALTWWIKHTQTLCRLHSHSTKT